MSINVGQLTIEMAANVVRLKTDMDNARKTVESAMGDIKKSAEMARSAFEMIGVGLSLNFFKDYIKGAIDAADAIKDLSKSTGLAVGELAGLKLAATQSGSDLEGTAQSINKLSVNIANDVKKFAAIGITAKDPLEAFKQLADVFVSIEDPQLKAAVAAEALGKKWQSAAPLLAEGSDGIAKMVARGKELSGVTPELTDASDKFNDTLAELHTKAGGVANQLAEKLLPSLQAVADEMLRSDTNTSSYSVALEGIKIIFDTIIVLGAEVKFTVDVTLQQIKAVVEYLSTIAGGGGFEAAKKIADEMTAYGENARKKVDEFTARILNGKPAEEEAIKARERSTATTNTNTAAIERNARAFIDSGNTKKAGIDEYAKMIKSADELVASLKFESDAYGLNNIEKETAINLQKLMNMGLKEGTEEYKKYTEAVIGAVFEKEQMKTLAEMKKKAEEEDKKSIEKFNAERVKEEEKFADEVKAINNQIGQSLTDALMNGAMNAGDFIKNMFKTMVLRPMLQPIMTGIVGAVTASFTPSAAALGTTESGGSISSSMGLLGAASSAKSAYEIVSGGFTALGNSVTSFVAEMGMNLSTVGEAGGVLATAGDSLLSAASSIGAVASYVGGVGAGLGLGNLISGGNSVIGGSSWSTVGAGTVIGALVGGPLGSAIGGAIGGVVNAAFGMGKKENTDSGIVGNLSASGSNLASYQEWTQKGGWFRSGDSGSDWSNLDPKLQKYMSNSVAATAIAVKQYADILKLPAKGIAEFSFEVKRSLAGLTAEEAQKQIDSLLAAYGNALASSVASEIGPFQRDGEEAGATLTRLATSLKSVNGVFSTLNIKLMDTSLYGADAASKLTDMFGGLDKLVAATDIYYQNFYSAQERANKTTQQLTDVFKQLGLQMPETKAQFRSMVEAARNSGNDSLFAALIKLAPAFSELTASVAALNTPVASLNSSVAGVSRSVSTASDNLFSLADTAFSALQSAIDAERTAAVAVLEKQRTALQAQKDVATQSVTALQSIFDYLSGQVSELGQSVDAAYAAAQGSAFIREALLAAHNTGYLPEQAALANAVSAARSGLTSATYTSSYEQKLAQAQLLAQLSDLNNIAGEQKTTAELQLEVAQEQLDSLEAQITSTQAYYDTQLLYAQGQINELKGINNSVLTVADAMASFGAAVNASRAQAPSGSDLNGQIDSLYQEILGRSAESGGLSFWANSGLTVDQIRQGIMGSQEAKLRGYATGGAYPGGLAMVGEHGPELINFNRPGQVYTSGQTSEILAGNGLAAEIQGLRDDIRAQARSTAHIQMRAAKVLERWEANGLPDTRVEI
jgi:hypothetical protein